LWWENGKPLKDEDKNREESMKRRDEKKSKSSCTGREMGKRGGIWKTKKNLIWAAAMPR
jgi:hypothetical protein